MMRCAGPRSISPPPLPSGRRREHPCIDDFFSLVYYSVFSYNKYGVQYGALQVASPIVETATRSVDHVQW
jgi:hypothetical protein